MKYKEVSGWAFSPMTTDLTNPTDEKAADRLPRYWRLIRGDGTDTFSHVQEVASRTVPHSCNVGFAETHSNFLRKET